MTSTQKPIRELLYPPFLALSILTLGLCYWFGDVRGLEGCALGLFATGFNTLALWGIVKLFGTAFQKGSAPRLGSILATLAFLMKLPVFILFGILAQKIGGPATVCFLAGLSVVYLCLVGWSLAQR